MDTTTFANSVRQKYPNGVASDGRSYRDISDAELTHKIVQKYPVYKDQVNDYVPYDQKNTIGLTPADYEEAGKVGEYAKEAIMHPLETAKGVVKGIPGGAAAVTKSIESLGKGAMSMAGLDTTGTGLDYGPVEELTAPSNEAQQVGYVGAQLLPIERAFTAGKPLVQEGVRALKPVVEDVVSAGKEYFAKKSASKVEKMALDAVTPNTKDLAVGEYENLLKQGKITPKTTTKPSEYVLTPKEIDIAKQNAPLLQSKDPVQNSINVINEIDKTDKSVGTFLKENNNIFNDAELRTYLADKMKDITDVMVDEKRLDKTKLQMIDNFIKSLPKNNMESLWTSRKEFDQYIEKAFSGSPNLQKELKKGLRNSVQDFIADRTPEGEYKAAMRKMTELFDLHDIVATKAAKEKGLNAIQAWMKANPVKTKLIGGASLLVPTGATIYQMAK